MNLAPIPKEDKWFMAVVLVLAAAAAFTIASQLP